MADWTPIREDELAEMEASEKAATPGPWGTSGGGYVGITAIVNGIRRQIGRAEVVGTPGVISDEECSANAVFIASARTDVPRLVAEIRRSREALREAREDTARLNWLIEALKRAWQGGAARSGEGLYIRPSANGHGPRYCGGIEGDSERSAIDAARAEPEAEPRG